MKIVVAARMNINHCVGLQGVLQITDRVYRIAIMIEQTNNCTVTKRFSFFEDLSV
jgi:hypothetical protein